MESIYLAGGCFWGVEKFLKSIKGVTSTTVGYANSNFDNPTYEQICEHKVNAIETVLVNYDEKIVSLNTILDNYFSIIDPTSVDKQGNDSGYQYRSGIYFNKHEFLPIIMQKINDEQNKYVKPIVVEVKAIENFFNAEEYHQDYLTKNPNGYCHIKF